MWKVVFKKVLLGMMVRWFKKNFWLQSMHWDWDLPNNLLIMVN